MENQFTIYNSKSFGFNGFFVTLRSYQIQINPQFLATHTKISVSYDGVNITEIPVLAHEPMDTIQDVVRKFYHVMSCGWAKSKFDESELKNLMSYINFTFGFRLEKSTYDEETGETKYFFHEIFDAEQNDGISVSLTCSERGMRYLKMKRKTNCFFEEGKPAFHTAVIERFFTVDDSLDISDPRQLKDFINMFKRLQ